jgi:hypothetical protein
MTDTMTSQNIDLPVTFCIVQQSEGLSLRSNLFAWTQSIDGHFEILLSSLRRRGAALSTSA